MLFMCWTRETGVIPGALAGLLLGMKALGAQMIASVTFIAILMTILIQAPTTEWLGRRSCRQIKAKHVRASRLSDYEGIFSFGRFPNKAANPSALVSIMFSVVYVVCAG